MRPSADPQQYLLRAVLESPPDVVIFGLDREYRYLAFNEAHRRTMKAIWNVDIEIQQNMLDLISRDDDRAKAKLNFDRALAGEHFTVIEQYGVDRKRRYYQDVYSPIVGPSGDIVGLTVFLTDITEQQHIQDQLAAYQQQLEQLVVERTAAVEVRDEVIRFVAHDLRNPLTTIRLGIEGLTEVLAQSAAHAGLMRQASAIARAVQRAEHMIRDLLDVATIQSSGLELNRTRLDAGDLVREAIESQRAIVGVKQLALDSELEGNLPDVIGDHERILRVFENLIGNAVKFTPQGGRISVGAARLGDAIAFHVTDTGPGIAPADLTRMFDAFWQSDSGDVRGRGLGLAICKRFVEAHGGAIWADSELGAGTTITFTIPIGSEEEVFESVTPSAPAP